MSSVFGAVYFEQASVGVCILPGGCILPCRKIKSLASAMRDEMKTVGSAETQKEHDVWWPREYVSRCPSEWPDRIKGSFGTETDKLMDVLVRRVTFAFATELSRDLSKIPIDDYTIPLMEYAAAIGPNLKSFRPLGKMKPSRTHSSLLSSVTYSLYVFFKMNNARFRRSSPKQRISHSVF